MNERLTELFEMAADRESTLTYYDDGTFGLEAMELLGFLDALWHMASDLDDLRAEIVRLVVSINDQRKERFE